MGIGGWTVMASAVLTAALSGTGIAPASAATVDDRPPSSGSEWAEWTERAERTERSPRTDRPDRADRAEETERPVRVAATPRLPLGNDISWPQCGTALPTAQAFAIVGLNGGLANDTNPCFATQLAWGENSVGGTGQPPVALYVNTANPGHGGSWWPTSNIYDGRRVANPYGVCTGLADVKCAYMYGYAKSYDNVTLRGVTDPASYLWWLDVELINTWSPDRTANAATLEGMTAHLKSIGARVGLYSTSYQWNLIVGEVSSTSNLRGLPSWLAGANGATGAKGMCSWPPLTPGGRVTMTQFVADDLDYDYSCI